MAENTSLLVSVATTIGRLVELFAVLQTKKASHLRDFAAAVRDNANAAAALYCSLAIWGGSGSVADERLDDVPGQIQTCPTAYRIERRIFTIGDRLSASGLLDKCLSSVVVFRCPLGGQPPLNRIPDHPRRIGPIKPVDRHDTRR